MTTWAEIAERCQNASDGDRELEARVHLKLRPELWHAPWEQHQLGSWLRMDGQPRGVVAPHYTTSVDAVLGLVAEKLKGVQVDLAIREDGTAAATIDVGARIDDLDSDPWKDGSGATPALALLAAFALAMQAEEGVQSVKEGAEP